MMQPGQGSQWEPLPTNQHLEVGPVAPMECYQRGQGVKASKNLPLESPRHTESHTSCNIYAKYMPNTWYSTPTSSIHDAPKVFNESSLLTAHAGKGSLNNCGVLKRAWKNGNHGQQHKNMGGQWTYCITIFGISIPKPICEILLMCFSHVSRFPISSSIFPGDVPCPVASHLAAQHLRRPIEDLSAPANETWARDMNGRIMD